MLRTLLFPLLLVPAGVVLAEDAVPTANTLLAETDREALASRLGERFYGLYVHGQKCGWLSMELATTENDTAANETAAPYVLTMRMRANLMAMGLAEQLHMEETLVFRGAPPYDLLSGTSRESGMGEAIASTLFCRQDGATLRQKEAGETRVLELPRIEHTLLDSLASELWAQRSDLEVGARLRSTVFSISSPEEEENIYTIERLERTEMGGAEVVLRHASQWSEVDGDLGTGVLSPSGDLMKIDIGGLFEARLEPEEVAKDIGVSADLFWKHVVRVDEKLGDGEELQKIVFRLGGEGAAAVESSSGQEVLEREGSRLLVTGLGHGSYVAATAEEIEDSLRATAECPAEHPLIVRAAGEAVGEAEDPHEKVTRLVAWVSQHVEDSYSANASTALEVLKTGEGDCSEHAALFNAMARAAGIPSREVSGLVYMGDEIGALGWHAWNEVVLDGRWVPVDATFEQHPVDPTHINLGTQLGTIFRVIGQLELEVVEVVRR